MSTQSHPSPSPPASSARACLRGRLPDARCWRMPISKPPLNPLGINRSPYGEVFAMAMQGPIETDFHAGMGSADLPGTRHHAPGSLIRQTQGASTKDRARRPCLVHRTASHDCSLPWRRLPKTRTNPQARQRGAQILSAPPGRRQAALRLSTRSLPLRELQLLHFFLTEPRVGTRPELTPSAAKLARGNHPILPEAGRRSPPGPHRRCRLHQHPAPDVRRPAQRDAQVHHLADAPVPQPAGPLPRPLRSRSPRNGTRPTAGNFYLAQRIDRMRDPLQLHRQDPRRRGENHRPLRKGIPATNRRSTEPASSFQHFSFSPNRCPSSRQFSNHHRFRATPRRPVRRVSVRA